MYGWTLLIGPLAALIGVFIALFAHIGRTLRAETLDQRDRDD